MQASPVESGQGLIGQECLPQEGPSGVHEQTAQEPLGNVGTNGTPEDKQVPGHQGDGQHSHPVSTTILPQLDHREFVKDQIPTSAAQEKGRQHPP